MDAYKDTPNTFVLSWDVSTFRNPTTDEREADACLVYCDRAILTEHAINHPLFRKAVWVVQGAKYRKVEPNYFEVDPLKSGDHLDLLSAHPDVKHIFYFWGMSPCAPTGEIPPTVFDIPLKLVQAVISTRGKAEARMWFLTSSAHAVAGGSACNSFQAIISGFTRTVMEEHPELKCTLVDLLPLDENGKITLSAIADLSCEVLLNMSNKEVAWRSAKRYLPQIKLSQNPVINQPRALSHDSPGAHLITGGYGALGQTLARSLVQKGVRQLVLVGRTPPSEETLCAISEIEGMGAKVLALSADITVREQVASLIEKTIGEFGSLCAVYHAAGVIEECSIDRLTAADFKKILDPKVLGGINLHEVTQHLPFCRLVLFSSVSAILGWARFCSYTAANAFLDALAHERRSEGLIATSLAFGPFSGRGLLADKGGQTEFPGLPSLCPNQVMGSIDWNEAARIPYSIVMKFNAAEWMRIRHAAGQEVLFYELIVPKDAVDEAYEGPLDLREQVFMQLPSCRLATLRRCVVSLISVTCSVSVEDIKPDVPFMSLGITSIASIDIRNELQDAFSLRLPATLLWNCTTLSSLLDYLAQRLELEVSEDKSNDSNGNVPKLQDSHNIKAVSEQEILNMSEEEVAHLLSAQLDVSIK